MKDEILRLRAEGKTYDEITKIMDCSKGTVAYYCGDGQKAATQRRRKQFARSNMTKIKNEFGGKCSKCGYNKCLDALDFHHLNPANKKDSVMSLLRNFTLETAIKEAKKCILVCANCHREIHSKLAPAVCIEQTNVVLG